MLRLRRLYFYLVLYAGLSMLLTGLATLARVLLEQLLGASSGGIGFGLFAGREQFREQTALGLALVVIGLPVWLLHWRVVRGWLFGETSEDERRSGLRRLYLYGVLLTTAITAFVSGRDLLEHALGLLLGSVDIGDRVAGIVRPLPYVFFSLLFWVYHHRLAATDRVVVGEDGSGATLRRWYVYLMAALGVGSLIANLAILGAQLWAALFDRGGLATLGPSPSALATASSGATAIVALLVWLYHWGWAERAAAVTEWHGENERHSILRSVYLYGLVLVTVGWTLANATQMLRFGLSSLLGVAPERVEGEPVEVALGRPLAAVLIFGLFWAFHWRAVRAESVAEAESGRRAGVRRIYFYVVSLVALAVTASGTAGLLRLLVDALLPGAPVGPGSLRLDLAVQLSGVLVATPVWFWHWAVIREGTSGPRAAEETRATTRRWYLYLVSFGAVAVLLVSGARIVYEATLVALGQPGGAAWARELGHLMASALVAAVVLWYHWWLVLRADSAALREARATRTAVAVVAGLDAAGAEQLERFARDALPGTRVKVVWADEAESGRVARTLARR